MLAKVQKWGNSLAVRLPSQIIKQAELAQDATVNISIEDHRIVIEPAMKFELKDMLAKITKANLHNEVDFGGPVGKEIL